MITCDTENDINVRIENSKKKQEDLIRQRQELNERVNRDKNVILAFPTSGTHLFRFVFEILTETATTDLFNEPIYKHNFSENVNFNIDETNKPWHKMLTPPEIEDVNNLIFILRNPKEAITRNVHFLNNCTPRGHEDRKYHYKRQTEDYFKNIDYYLNFKGNKKLFYYDDMLNNPSEFIQDLYSFMNIDKPHKLEYLLKNYERVFTVCKNCDYGKWLGSVSNSHNYWFNRLSDKNKDIVNEILNPYYSVEKYKDLITRYYTT